MQVVVAEKFLLARALAEALIAPRATAMDDAFQGVIDGDRTAITWADGHPLEQADPEFYNPAWRHWNVNDLPIAPPGFQFELLPRDDTTLRRLERWLARATSVVNACDAAREGELIFDRIAQYCHLDERKQRIDRLWITDTTPTGLRRAWSTRLEHGDRKLTVLRMQGRTRADCDWLWGINGSRYVTKALETVADIRGRTISIGRVRSPVQAIIADRSREVALHEPEPFFRGVLTFVNEQGDKCDANLLAPPHLKFGTRDSDWTDRTELEQRIEHIRMEASRRWSVVDGDNREAAEYPPPPFDTTDLQRTANRIYGWSAKYTMRQAQLLYERHGAISYPRTDSSKLPVSMQENVFEIADTLWTKWLPAQYPNEIAALEDRAFSMHPDRYFDEKVGDHYAIIPTGVIPPRTNSDGTAADSYLLWTLIVRRFLGAWLPPAKVFASSRAFISPYVNGEQLRALIKASPVLDPGWLWFEDLFGTTRGFEKPLAKRMLDKALPPMGLEADFANVSLSTLKTSPAELYSYDMLLHRMQSDSLGTPATRAEIINELIEEGSVVELQNGRLHITENGEAVVAHVRAHGGELLFDPKLTAFWEKQLDSVGKRGPTGRTREQVLESVMQQIRDLGARLVAPALVEDIVFCPKTGLLVQSEAEGWRFAGWPDIICKKKILDRDMRPSEYRDVLMGGRTGSGPYDGFVSRNSGEPFRAWLRYDPGEKRFKFVFKQRKS